ncbi:MAG: reductive dehalogenase [Anaerolineae bacterium]|jgi:epoxyqueuosine reductase|nr:reductive dehalogenase [Anaerolineae bacterium]MBT7076063.1 reductive dehalogenase [Anaerolineae bacterium]MBT7782659.1 reductive dehalogenase [Anaerolineae bacterium]
MSSEVTDREANFEILENFEAFHQKNEIFRRSQWDERILGEKTERFYASHGAVNEWRKRDGFTQKDYALRNASWHISDILSGVRGNARREGFTDAFSLGEDIAPEKVSFSSSDESAKEIKRVAKLFGAGMVRITEFDERWQYQTRFSDFDGKERSAEITPDLGLTHVIVLAVPMSYGLMKTVSSVLGSSAAGLGYSDDATLLVALSQYIRGLGYEAIGSLNDTGLSIPYAVKAGLGEFGRNGLLISKDFGPRVRLGRIYTNLPLAHDRPIDFGVQKFCEICKHCAKFCPSQSIPLGEPTATPLSISNHVGVRKWTVDVESCFAFWTAQNTDCATCIRTCPYNKDYRHWWHRAVRWLAGTWLRRFVLALDEFFGYGKREKAKLWWTK